MRLCMKNFKCFEKHSLEIPDGLTLLTAPSGFGKSTTVDAVSFALWGSKDGDLIAYGKRRCDVELELDGITVSRSKAPNHVTVLDSEGREIENPQEFLDRHYTKYYKNFVDMTGTKRLEILESLSDQFNDVGPLMDKIKTFYSEGTRILASVDKEIEILKRTLDRTPVPVEVEKPDPEHRGHDTELLAAKLSNAETNLSRLTLAQSIHEKTARDLSDCGSPDRKARRKLAELEKLDAEFRIINSQRNRAIYRLGQLEEIVSGYTIEGIKVELEKMSMINAERLNRSAELENLKRTVNYDYKKYVENYSGIPTKFSCPRCQVRLNEKDGCLVEADDHGDIVACKRILWLESNMPGTTNQEKAKLESILSYLNEIETLNSRLSTDLKVPEIVCPETYRKIKEDAANLDRFEFLAKKLSECRLVTHEEIEEASRLVTETFQNLKLSREYARACELRTNYESLLASRTELEKEFKEAERKHSNLTSTMANLGKIKRILEEAQSAAISGIVNSINVELKFFAKKFFEDPIDIYLTEFKQIQSTKQIKHQINITVDYKSMSVKPQMLSTGEMARVRLAIDLAIYKLTESKAPLMLDEVASNLDSELSTKIFNTIREYLDDKNVLVISHQAIEGVFDHVITEENF